MTSTGPLVTGYTMSESSVVRPTLQVGERFVRPAPNTDYYERGIYGAYFADPTGAETHPLVQLQHHLATQTDLSLNQTLKLIYDAKEAMHCLGGMPRAKAQVEAAATVRTLLDALGLVTSSEHFPLPTSITDILDPDVDVQSKVEHNWHGPPSWTVGNLAKHDWELYRKQRGKEMSHITWIDESVRPGVVAATKEWSNLHPLDMELTQRLMSLPCPVNDAPEDWPNSTFMPDVNTYSNTGGEAELSQQQWYDEGLFQGGSSHEGPYIGEGLSYERRAHDGESPSDENATMFEPGKTVWTTIESGASVDPGLSERHDDVPRFPIDPMLNDEEYWTTRSMRPGNSSIMEAGD